MASIQLSLLVASVFFASSTEGRLEKGCRLVTTRKFDRSLLASTWPSAVVGCPSLGRCERRCEAHGKACKAVLYSPRTNSSLATCVIHLQQIWQRTVGYSVRVGEARNSAIIRKVKTCGVERREATNGNRCFQKVTDFSNFHNMPSQNLHRRDECFKKCQVNRRCLAVSIPVGKKQCAMMLKPSYMQYMKKCDNRGRCKMVSHTPDNASGMITSTIASRTGINEHQCKHQCAQNPRCSYLTFHGHSSQPRYNQCYLRTTLYYLRKQCQQGNRNCKMVNGRPKWSDVEQSYEVTAGLTNYRSVCGRRCLQDSNCLFMRPYIVRNRVGCRSYVAKITMLNKCQDVGLNWRCHLKSASSNVIWRAPYYIKTQRNLNTRGLEQCKEACEHYKNRCYAIQYGKRCQLYLLFDLMKNECRMVSSRRVCRLVQMRLSGTKKMRVQPQTQQIKTTYQQCAQSCSRNNAKCTGIGYEKTTSMCRVFGFRSYTITQFYKICNTVGQCTLTKIAQMPPNMQYYRINQYRSHTATPARCVALCKRDQICQGTRINHSWFTRKTHCSFQKNNKNFRFYEKVLTGTNSRLIPTDPLTVVKRPLTSRSYYGSQYTLKKCQRKCQLKATCIAMGHKSNGRQRRGATYYQCYNYYKQEKPRGNKTAVYERRFSPDMTYGHHHGYFSWSQLKNLTRDNGTDDNRNEKFNQPTFYGKLCDGDDKTSCIIRKMNSTDLGFRYLGEFNSNAQSRRQMNMTTRACVKKCKDASWCVGVQIRKSGNQYMQETYLRRKRGPGGANKGIYCAFYHFVDLYKKTCAVVPKKRFRMDHATENDTMLRQVASEVSRYAKTN